MVSLRLKILLVIISVLLTVFLSFYIPISTFVWICMIPTIAFNFITKRYFMAIISVLVFITITIMFSLMVVNGIEETSENITMIAYLYQQIFPFGLAENLITLLNTQMIYYCTVFIILTIFIAWIAKFNEFKIMIAFSYLIFAFTTFYLVLNIFLYLIPALRVSMLNNPVLHQILVVFYAILPFIVFVLILLFCFTLYDFRNRIRNHKDIKQLDSWGKRFKWMKYFKYFSYLFVIVFIVVLIFGGILLV